MSRILLSAAVLAFGLGGCAATDLTSAVDQAALPCAEYEELLALEAEYRGIFLGELHGTLNSAEIVGCFVHADRMSGGQLIVSLEGSRAAYDGRGFHEAGRGGTGVGTPALIAIAEEIEANPALGQIHFHDDITPPLSDEFASLLVKDPSTWTEADISLYLAERERAIGRNINALPSEGVFIIALGGSLHAARKEIVPQIPDPAGAHLPEDIASVLLTSSVAGEAYNCSPDCARRDVMPAPLVLPQGKCLGQSALQPKDAPQLRAYDYVFDLGRLSPIPVPVPPT